MKTLDGKMHSVMELAEKLKKTPRRYGTEELLTGSEIHLIHRIGEYEGDLSVTDIARLMGVTKGAVSQTLKRLEGKGLTAKKPDPQNASRSIVTLTETGMAALRAHQRWHKAMDGGFRAYYDSLSPDRVEFLEEFFTRWEDFLKRLSET